MKFVTFKHAVDGLTMNNGLVVFFFIFQGIRTSHKKPFIFVFSQRGVGWSGPTVLSLDPRMASLYIHVGAVLPEFSLFAHTKQK